MMRTEYLWNLFYLDQNISDRISKYEDKYEIIRNIIYPKGMSLERKLAITPFSLIEFSGATILDLFQGEFPLSQNPNYEILIPEAFDFYKKHIKSDFEKYLLKKLDEQHSYKKSQMGRYLINEYKSYIKYKREFKEEFIKTISIDRVSDLDFSQIKDKEKYLILMSSVIQNLKSDPNINMVRLLFKSFECSLELVSDELKELEKLGLKSTELYKQKKKSYAKNKIEYEQIKFDNRKEIVDTEIIHLACFGHNSIPLKIITAENQSTILSRVYLYKNILGASSETNSISLNFSKDFEIEFLNQRTFESINKVNLKDI